MDGELAGYERGSSGHGAVEAVGESVKNFDLSGTDHSEVLHRDIHHLPCFSILFWIEECLYFSLMEGL